jgi:hypothetical protein
MRIATVLHRSLLAEIPSIHQVRATAIGAAVTSLAHGAFLTVTALGRGLQSRAKTKHNIKRMDRLLSNRALHTERLPLYQALCRRLCQGLKHPVVIVDWSDIVEQQRLLVIRAALAVNGRAIPLYEAVYPLKHYNTPRTHQAFLETLKTLLPGDCIPIIVTDAGFRGPWFRAVESLGWYYLGRVRNAIHYRPLSTGAWQATQQLYRRANQRIRYLGHCELSSKRPYACHLYLYKKRSRHTHAKRSTYHQAKHSASSVFAQQQRDPWLLATNMTPEFMSAPFVVQLYRKRMGIEAAFRDLKSDQFGFGLTLSRSRNIERLNTLLLIAALTTVCLWWIGLTAQQRSWQRHFQANTVRDRLVLSMPFLALQVIRRADYSLTLTELMQAQFLLQQHIIDTHQSEFRGDL